MAHGRIPLPLITPLMKYMLYGKMPLDGKPPFGSIRQIVTGVIDDEDRTLVPRNQQFIDLIIRVKSWLLNFAPVQSYGSYEKARDWIDMDPQDRREILEMAELIYSEKEETFITLLEGPAEELFNF